MSDNDMTQDMPFHEYLRRQIDSSDIKQSDMSEAMGFGKPNIITMFKQGKTRVPLEKVPKFAEVLGLNQRDLLRMAMKEYCPELLNVCEKFLVSATVSKNEEAVFSKNEKEIIAAIREWSQGTDPAIASIDHKIAVGEFVKKLMQKNE